MKKEVIIVILVGIVIGTIVVFGIYTAQTALEKQETSDDQQTVDSLPTQSEVIEHTLSISNPEDESVVTEEQILLSGSTSPNSVVAIITPENELLLTTDKQGNFTTEIPLSGGANEITISSFNEAGEKAEKVLTVVYSTAQL